MTLPSSHGSTHERMQVSTTLGNQDLGAASAPLQNVQTQVGLVIDGKEIHTRDASPVFDPAAPAEIVGYAASASEDDTRRALHSAQRAFLEWGELALERRIELLRKACSALNANHTERVELMVRENGKVRWEAEIDLSTFVRRFELAIGLNSELRVRTLPFENSGAATQTSPQAQASSEGVAAVRSEVHAVPTGVVTIIIPYNWPLAILSASLPYALLAGNTVVVKPPPTTPLAVVSTLLLLAKHLPPGVVNVITGNNQAVAPLICDPLVRRVVFTGSTKAGRQIMAMAAQNLTRVTLELGGNDPAIVLDDVVLDEALLRRFLFGSFLTTGQVCMAIKRVYVHESKYTELVNGLSDLLSTTRLGHGLAPDTTMGPLNSARQRDFVQALCRSAVAAGARLREFGELSSDVADKGGYFMKPALVLDPAPAAGIVVEEQFGPALPILRYRELQSVIASVNEDWAGLSSSVWSSDYARAAGVARRLRTGTTWINDAGPGALDDRAPYGGFRQSGVGRELAAEGLREFTEPHVVTFPPDCAASA